MQPLEPIRAVLKLLIVTIRDDGLSITKCIHYFVWQLRDRFSCLLSTWKNATGIYGAKDIAITRLTQLLMYHF